MDARTQLSEDGKWFWDGSRWSADHAVLTGSIVFRLCAWTLIGGLPLGAVAGVVVGPVLSGINSILGVVVVAMLMIAAESLVLYIVVLGTPRIAIDHGRIRIGHLGNSDVSNDLPVSRVKSVELVRGSWLALMLTRHGAEDKVLLHLTRGRPIELGWEAFSRKASRLARVLNVPIIHSATKLLRNREGAASKHDAPVQVTDTVTGVRDSDPWRAVLGEFRVAAENLLGGEIGKHNYPEVAQILDSATLSAEGLQLAIDQVGALQAPVNAGDDVIHEYADLVTSVAEDWQLLLDDS